MYFLSIDYNLRAVNYVGLAELMKRERERGREGENQVAIQEITKVMTCLDLIIFVGIIYK